MNKQKFLWKLCRDGWDEREHHFVDSKQVYWARLKEEFQLITELGYTDYFLIIWDLMKWAREQGILVGHARGSVAGCLLAFLTRITDVDPIRFDLMLERFINPVRSKFDPPDVDMDFQASRRNEVKQYVIDKYGKDRVCAIGSHSRSYASGAIKGVARVMDLDYQRLNKVVAHQLYDTTLEEAYEQLPSFHEWVDENDEHARCFEIAVRLQDLVRHRSVHPSGLVITCGDLEDYVPICRVKDVVCTQWKDTYVGKRGILKVDILGLNTLDILQTTIDIIREVPSYDSDSFQGTMVRDTSFELLDIPLDDGDVLEIFNKGHTTGVFQFDAFHQRKMTQRLGVQSFDDLVAAAAIARPATARTGISDSIIDRKHGREPTIYPHESVKELLKSTYGYPIYQELVMKMAYQAGNIPLVDTEIMRDAIKHKKHEVMARYEEEFKQGASDNGATENQARKMWDMIQGASGYGYNKAHSTAYSLISYDCGWFKVHFPLEFMTACLQWSGGAQKTSRLIAEARRLNLEVLPAHINWSKENFSTDGTSIIAGLTAIKYVGAKAARVIVENQPYRSKSDFSERVPKRQCNKRIMESLEKAGVFGGTPAPSDILESYGCWLGELPDLEDLYDCELCELCERRFKIVTGWGNPTADVMFVGEAPGHEEDRQGRPFIGRSGKVLRFRWMLKLKMMPMDAWITNVVKCAPKDESGKMGHPSDEQKILCSLWLEREIESVQPKIIVALGAVALQALSTERSVTAMHGKTFDVVTGFGGKNGIVGFSMWHPAATLYNSDIDAMPDIKKLKTLMKEVL